MSNNYTNTDVLIHYLDDELSQEEKQQVENELKVNPDLRQQLEKLSLARQAVKTFGVKQKVASIHAEMMQELATKNATQPGKLRNLTRSLLRVAASLLVALLGFGVYQYITISSEKLFSATYQPYSLSVSRGPAETGAIEKAYTEKDYPAVLELFAKLQSANQKDNFIAGQTYLALHDYSKAIGCFNNVLSLNAASGATIFKDDAEYYVALSYLGKNEFGRAYPILLNIRNNPQHLYNDKLTDGIMRKLKLLDWKN